MPVRPVTLIRADVSEEHTASVIRMTRIAELEATSAITQVTTSSILVTLIMEEIRSSETSGSTRATWGNIPEDGILHSYLRENLKFYIELTGWPL
jgi:hypothetical protein